MYLKKAADQNNIDALEFLGSLYLNGEEVQKDEMQAFEYYRRASEKGSKLGSYNAAYICYYSDKPDKRKELGRYIDRLYRKDFDNEDFLKANFLAGVSNIRSYIPSYYKDAQRHFEAAIKKGDLDAQYVMESCFIPARGLIRTSLKECS